MRIRRAQVMHDPAEVTGYKPRILDYLWANRAGQRNTRPPYRVDPAVDAQRLGQAIGLPLHDVVHVLWSLQSQEAIRFRERKYATKGNTGRGNMDQFVITARGAELRERLRAVQDARAGAMLVESPREVAETMRTASAIAAEAPRTVVDATIQDQAERRARASNGAAVVPVVPPDAEPTFVDHILGRDGAETPPTPTPRPDIPPLDPELVGVLARYRARERVREAAQALEAAGMEDQALVIMDTIQDHPAEDAMARHLMGCPFAREPEG